ncbi:hypothetical protein [Hyphomonas pacifica]|uniref:Peptidase M61 catalytic domain-containing protein n=1 Tax=Hyphomonas pacifica TaxID=1280941 RepID=A0A062U3A8_9PROT|nr:hypothetical protein [Hyphomonas pacifica]KCZ52777.1 hypothetical protein HY2_07540 [Hyphomonas pacifica]RAN33063.1 hypothetical protein HY3_13515 [Hyphomonas pacifica]RAN33736.1 hypothetical protein HY11_03325 [Hyphomonas pacifica]
MIRLALFLILAFAAACSKPQPVVPEGVEQLTVTLSPEEERILATWQLPKAATEFSFNEDDMPVSQRESDWTPAGEGWVFDGQTLSREDGSAFQEFSFTLPAASMFYDRYYVPVSKVGKGGWVIFANTLAPAEGDFEVRFDGLPESNVIYGEGEITSPNEPRDGNTLGIFYIGPAENLSMEGGILIAGPEIPDAIRNDISGNLENAVTKLTDAWGYAPEIPPAVIITYDQNWHGQSWKGGVLEEVITFHLRGMDLSGDTSEFTDHLRNTSLHEAIHVWNGTLFESSENSEQSWVHEGAAEYIANRLWMDDATFNAAVQKALNGCILQLGDHSIRGTEIASRGQTPYRCGHVVHLAAELSALKHTGKNVLGVWKDVYDAAGDERVYDSATFVTAAEADGGTPFSDIMNLFNKGLTPENRAALVADLVALGADIVPLTPESETPYETTLSVRVLRDLLIGYCEGGYGFTQTQEGFALETAQRCGDALAGDPLVSRLNGHDLLKTPVAAYFAAREACQAGEPLVLTRPDGPALEPLDCPEGLAALPELYDVRSAGTLPPL